VRVVLWMSLAALSACTCAQPERGKAKKKRTPAPLRVPDAWVDAGLSKPDYVKIAEPVKQGLQSRLLAGGIVSLNYQGKELVRESFGYADLDAKTPFTEDTPVRIASMTKPMTATVILMLVDEGTLELDVPVERWVPELNDVFVAAEGGKEPAESPTLRQLLTHQSGIAPEGSLSDEEFYALAGSGPSGAVEWLLGHGLVRHPGSAFQYAGTDYQIAARVAEKATGKTFEDLFQERLLDPLGMESTYLVPPDGILETMATPYKLDAPGKYAIAEEHYLIVESVKKVDAAAGVISNADDLREFWAFHAAKGLWNGEQLLSETSSEIMRTTHVPEEGIGMGFVLNMIGEGGVAKQAYHGGRTGVYGWFDTDNDSFGVFVSNMSSDFMRPIRMRVEKRFRAAVESANYRKSHGERPAEEQGTNPRQERREARKAEREQQVEQVAQ